ncbi:hypothetical protein FOL47_005827 [Perkinsus chesapeaki]|uniref:Uncharacterized protein n=1 Tax=Perkinsus chesapeaki TaxID=330153 RepID=A0A7J6LVR0_PERCH|nr:hypothetical protein FOL47_005827 [Perkinsus chesapeaki]
MQTHDKEDVIVVNLGHVKLCVSLLVFHLLEMFIQWIRIFNIDRESGTFMFCSVLGDLTAYILVGRQAYRCFDEWTTFASKVKSFSLRRAKCTSREDHKKLTKLIRRMYGSEANFAAVVKRLCVGRGTEEHAPMWFLSPTSLRIMSASFVPSIAYGAASALLVMFTEWERPMANIASIGSAPEFPCASATFPWAIRTRLLPVLIRSFQVPLMLLFVHKLAGKKLQPRGHLLLGILYAFAFIILTSLSQFTCGLGLFHGPFYEDPQGGLWYEGSLLLAGLTELGFVWSVSKWLYSHQLPSIIS